MLPAHSRTIAVIGLIFIYLALIFGEYTLHLRSIDALEKEKRHLQEEIKVMEFVLDGYIGQQVSREWVKSTLSWNHKNLCLAQVYDFVKKNVESDEIEYPYLLENQCDKIHMHYSSADYHLTASQKSRKMVSILTFGFAD